MPILDAGDDAFAGFDITREFNSQLHSSAIAGVGGQVSKFYADLRREKSVWQQWQNFSSLSRFGVANIAITSGLSLEQLGALRTLFVEAPRIAQGDIGKAIAREVIGGALLAFDEALEVVGTKAPIVGWILQLGLFVYEVIKQAVTDAKSDAPDMAIAKAHVYDRDADEELVRLMLPVLKGGNWTELFLPQQHPADVALTSLAYTDRGLRDGYQFEVVGEPWGWGLTPGLSSAFTGAIGFYQTPRHLIGSNRDAGIESITGFGPLNPSTMQFGLAVWQMVCKNSPQAFNINGDRIVSAWYDHFDVLYDWMWQDTMRTTDGKAFSTAGRDWMRSQIMNACEWWDRQFEKTRVVKNGKPITPASLPNRYTRENQWKYSQLIDYYVSETWRPRLSGFLETLTCAYVPPDAPALRMDSRLADKHHEMRVALLEHKAVHDVEASRVPDREFRSSVEAAQRQPDLPLTTTPGDGGPLIVKLAIDYIPTIDPNWPQPDPPPAPDPGLTETGGGDMVGLLVAGAVMAGAFAGAKLLTRRG